jgi:hypothetical protein
MRISSQGTVIMIDDAVTPPTAAILSATHAKPCVITLAVAATPPVVGTVIVPRNTGWLSIEGTPFKVKSVAAQAVTLEDSDSSREQNPINTTGTPPATLDMPTFIEMCRSTFQANNPAGATIDVTTLCDNAHRIVAGLPAIGTWTAAGFYDCKDTAIARARDAYRSGDDVIIDVRLPDGCGLTFAAIVNTFDVTLGINAAVANTLGGQIDGQVHFYETPAPGFVPSAAPPQQQVAA